MSLDIKSLIGDQAQQIEGVWISHPDDKDAEFHLVYSEKGTPRTSYSRGHSKLRRKARGREIEGDKLEALLLDMLVEHVVKDWRGITSNGKPFDYSKENCRMLLTHSAQLLDFIARESADIENFGGKAGTDEESESADERMKSGASVGN